MLPRQTIVQMASAAETAIENAVLRGSSGMKAKPRTEVGMVAAVTLAGVPNIATQWRRLLGPNGNSLNLCGVFCHGAPLVKFKGAATGTTTCELADLLVVADRRGSTRTIRRAALIQAKMAGRAQVVSFGGASSVRQLQLYQNWPSFSFVDPTYGHNAFLLATNGPDQSGTFGVIDRHFRNSQAAPPIWTQHAANPTPHIISIEPTLGTFLAELAGANRHGFGRFASEAGGDDWSDLVNLLLRVTYAQTFRQKTIFGPTPRPRGVSMFAFLSPSKSRMPYAGQGWEPPLDGVEIIDEPPRGISVLHIDIETTQ